MNIAFVETQDAKITYTRAALTELDRLTFAATLAPHERLESFLYASPPGAPWPCGPTPEEWQTLCAAIAADPALQPIIEAMLAASRHRYLATVEN